MNITIEEGIAIPATTRKTNAKFQPIYDAVKALKTGQSFEIEVEQTPGLKNPTANLVYNVRKYFKALPGEYVAKATSDTKMRVWCLKAAEQPKPVAAEQAAENSEA